MKYKQTELLYKNILSILLLFENKRNKKGKKSVSGFLYRWEPF